MFTPFRLALRPAGIGGIALLIYGKRFRRAPSVLLSNQLHYFWRVNARLQYKLIIFLYFIFPGGRFCAFGGANRFAGCWTTIWAAIRMPKSPNRRTIRCSSWPPGDFRHCKLWLCWWFGWSMRMNFSVSFLKFSIFRIQLEYSCHIK